METSAQRLYAEAFSSPREKRSEEYKAGVLAALKFRFNEATNIRCTHKAGTAQSDAFHAGTREGHCLARDYKVAEGLTRG